MISFSRVLFSLALSFLKPEGGRSKISDFYTKNIKTHKVVCTIVKK